MGDIKRRLEMQGNDEQMVVVKALLDKRNELIKEGADSKLVDKMLLKALNAPEIRFGIFKHNQKNKHKLLDEGR